MYEREAGSPWPGCGAMRPPDTSAGSHAGGEHTVAPPSIAARVFLPVVPPDGGPTAFSVVPLPVAETVVLEPVHVVPSESTVMTPCTVDDPTVTCDPPSTLSGTHPVGSSTHSAGGLPVPWFGRMVAERCVHMLLTPKIFPNMPLSLVFTITRIRWHCVAPSLFPAPPQRESVISDAGTGKCTLTHTSPTVVDGAAWAVALLQVLLIAEQKVVELMAVVMRGSFWLR